MKYSVKALRKVVQGLKNIFDATAEEVAKAMRDAEYTAEEVARGIKEVYDASDGDIFDALDYAGYNTNEIDNAIMSII